MGKGKGKRKAQDDEAAQQPIDPEIGLVTDTDFHTGASQALTFREIYEFYKSDQEPAKEEDAQTWKNVKRSGIHLVAARPAILPWHEMTRWILNQARAKGVIEKADGTSLVAFAPANVTSIYFLPKPEIIADLSFVNAFNAEHSDENDWLQEWWHDEDEFKPSTHRTCRIQDFAARYRPVAMMFCRLTGNKNCNLFRKEWIPLMHAVVEEGKILNWASLLAESMIKALKTHLEAPEAAKPPFFMAAYLLDMVMAQVDFPDISMRWVSNSVPVHEFFSLLWVDNYIPHFYTICDRIAPRVHTVLFGHPPRRISAEAALTIKRLGGWFVEDFFTIIRVYGNEEVSYLPVFVPDRLVIREIAFQTVKVGAFVRLNRHSKKTWPEFPISVGRFSLINRQYAEKEAKELERLQLCRAPHRFFDPHYKIKDMFSHYNLSCPEHQPDPDEERFQDIFDYVGKLREVVSAEEMTRARFRAIDIRADLFEKRDLLLKGSPADMEQAEEERKRQRAERWDRGVLEAKKKASKTSGPRSRTGATRKPTPTQDEARPITVSGKDTGEGREKLRSEHHSDPDTSAVKVPAGQNSPGGGEAIIPDSEVPDPNNSEGQTIVDSEVVSQDIGKEPTANPKDSEGDPAQQTEEEQRSEHLAQSEGRPESTTHIDTEVPPDPFSTPGKKGPELSCWSGAGTLITTEVEEGNTIISSGSYSFHSKTKAIMRKRAKRTEANILWTPQGGNPTERAVDSAAALGMFAVMNLGAVDESRKETELLRAQVEELSRDLRKASLERATLDSQLEQERATLNSQLEQEREKQRDLAADKYNLQEQVSSLKADLEKTRVSQADLQSFRAEALLANDKGIDTRALFFSLIKNNQELYLDLLRNEESLSRQKEELQMMKGIRKKVAEYQKQHQTNQIPQFSAMRLRRIQTDLSSEEDLNSEAGEVISSAKKECHRIRNSADVLIEKTKLPRMDRWEATLSEGPWIEKMREEQQARRNEILQMKELKWEDVKLTLVDENHTQAQIESWCTATEEKLQKKVMKGVCRANYALEQFKAENLLSLTDAHDQWEAFLEQQGHGQHQAESSSVATETIDVEGSV